MKIKKIDKLKEQYSEAKLNFKKELISLLIVDLALFIATIATYIFLKQIFIIAIGAICILAMTYFSLSKPKRTINQNKKKLETEFVHIFSYFAIFVKNGRPVYNALEDCLRYSSETMAEKIRTLLEDIDDDKSVTPYTKFSDNFDNLEIKQLLVSVYKMSVEGGGEEYLRQFDMLFTALSNSNRTQRLENEANHYGNFNFLPLIASAISMGVIAIAVVVLMEEYSNVI